MNERIYELIRLSAVPADQAEDYSLAKGLVEPTEKLDVAKFAELIVKECINKVENLSPGYKDYRNQIEDAFRRDCVEQIKQHFGINSTLN